MSFHKVKQVQSLLRYFSTLIDLSFPHETLKHAHTLSLSLSLSRWPRPSYTIDHLARAVIYFDIFQLFILAPALDEDTRTTHRHTHTLSLSPSLLSDPSLPKPPKPPSIHFHGNENFSGI